MFAAEHFEYGVYALAVRAILHDLFVVVLIVVAAVLQSELFHVGELFVGRGRTVHLDAENLADLHCSRTHSPSDGMNQDARSSAPPDSRGRLSPHRSPCHPRLPVAEVS